MAEERESAEGIGGNRSAEPQGEGASADDDEKPSWIPAYPDLDPNLVGEEAATEVIRRWIEEAYDELRPRVGAPNAGLDWNEHVIFPLRSDHRVWHRLGLSLSLWSWMIVVTREPEVLETYGETKEPLDGPFFRLQRLVLAFLNRLVSTSWPELDEGSFNREAGTLWQYLHLREVTYEAGVLIYNLHGPGVETDLGESITLRPATKEWMEGRFTVQKEWTGVDFTAPGELPTGLWALTVTYPVPKQSIDFEGYSYEGNKTGDALLERGLLRLRLVAPHRYSVTGRYRLAVNDPYDSPTMERIPGWVSVLTEIDPLTVTPDFLSQAEQAGKLIPREDQSSPLLSLALRSFQASFTRTAWNAWPDRVVDLVICLEAMFSGSTHEITHQVAMRYALLLGKDFEDSVKRMEAITALYNLRSRIVHASIRDRDTAAKDVIKEWLGAPSIPQKVDHRGPLASTLAARFVAEALLAFLRLRAAGVDPLPEKPETRKVFLDVLDHLAFDSQRRTQMRTSAGVLST